MNILLLLYAVAAGSYGLAAVIFPGFLIPLLWNNPPGPEANILLQGWGAGLLGFATMAFLARKLDKSLQRVIISGILIYFTCAVIAWVIDAFGRGWTGFGIVSFASYLIFAFPFIYQAYFRK